jgi:methanol metabolism-related c-type cytochrome
MKRTATILGVLAAGLLLGVTVKATTTPNVTASEKKEVDGKYFAKNGDPTYDVLPNGSVDWYTYSGFRRYHSDCHVCHGPDGLGSTYAPALVDSLKTLDYEQFATVVASGRQKVDAAHANVMPAFGTNPNVMCYLDDIYVYLKARSDSAVGRGRPAKHEPQPQGAKDYEKQCMR